MDDRSPSQEDVGKVSELFAIHLKTQKEKSKSAITVEDFSRKIDEVSAELEKVEQSDESEPEERVKLARLCDKKIKHLQKILTSQENFLNLVAHNGLFSVQHKYSSILLSLKERADNIIKSVPGQKSTVSPLSDSKKAKVVTDGMALFAQAFKVKRAYQGIYNGRKYKKAELKKSLSNPIKVLSNKNIQLIKKNLQDDLINDIKKGTLAKDYHNMFGLKPDEMELFAALLNLPYKIQHATNHFADIARSGRLNSLTEIHRYNPSFLSPFTTSGNLQELGNGGFVFFRRYVDGANGEETRYGNSRVVMDLSVLRDIGWISLHDQLVPFSNIRRKQTLYRDKRIIFQAEPSSINNKAQANKSADAITYTYRKSAITSYGKGKKDTQKEFGESIETLDEKITFTEEIFYGPDILPGIALSIIYRLRMLQACGYRATVLEEFNKATQVGRVILLGKLVKDFYRIEGKYPVSMQLQYNNNNQSCFFSPYAASDRKRTEKNRQVLIENPDGDGRLNVDLSVSSKNAELAFYSDRLKYTLDRISVLQKHPDIPAYVKELDILRKQKIELDTKLNQAKSEKESFLEEIAASCSAQNTAWLKGRSYEFLQMAAGPLLNLIRDEVVKLPDLIPLSVQRLFLLTNMTWIKLLQKGQINWQVLNSLSDQELEVMAEANVSLATKRGHTFSELLDMFRNNDEKFEWVTCEDFNELLYELAPHIPRELLALVKNLQVKIDWKYIRENLCKSERSLLDISLSTPEVEPNEYEDNDRDYESDEFIEERKTSSKFSL